VVKMINARLGIDFWVTEDRVDDYLAAGHKLAADVSPEPEKKPTAKKTTKKTKK